MLSDDQKVIPSQYRIQINGSYFTVAIKDTD